MKIQYFLMCWKGAKAVKRYSCVSSTWNKKYHLIQLINNNNDNLFSSPLVVATVIIVTVMITRFS